MKTFVGHFLISILKGLSHATDFIDDGLQWCIRKLHIWAFYDGDHVAYEDDQDSVS